MIGPHVAGKGVIFAVTQWNGCAAPAMRWKLEADSIALHFNPEVAAGGACSPA